MRNDASKNKSESGEPAAVIHGIDGVDYQWIAIGLSHQQLPRPIYDEKLLRLCRKLFLNILSAENVLKVHPIPLACDPFVEGFTKDGQLFRPVFNSILYSPDKSTPKHSLQGNLVVFKKGEYLFK